MRKAVRGSLSSYLYFGHNKWALEELSFIA
jgi:hypothetical protein